MEAIFYYSLLSAALPIILVLTLGYVLFRQLDTLQAIRSLLERLDGRTEDLYRLARESRSDRVAAATTSPPLPETFARIENAPPPPAQEPARRTASSVVDVESERERSHVAEEVAAQDNSRTAAPASERKLMEIY